MIAEWLLWQFTSLKQSSFISLLMLTVGRLTGKCSKLVNVWQIAHTHPSKHVALAKCWAGALGRCQVVKSNLKGDLSPLIWYE